MTQDANRHECPTFGQKPTEGATTCQVCSKASACSMDVPCGWYYILVDYGHTHDSETSDGQLVCSLDCAKKYLDECWQPDDQFS